ncbi:MAG: ECF transporter S component [Candidatus Mcinerneyibacterium aminivorans]|uniref:Riboflavin transporter n=1 Tax=Candidatus Mcinerneyibacterium aminivorans TaxID=2703815 RepID=A0A5D0MH86_9BACT|nr:MAG: ECF transporter S component [Candidatus Mcinerneyibacterium aminivorans]
MKKNFIKISLLSAFSTVLMFLEFPFPFFPHFLKFDFSDIPAVIGAFALGPMAGVAIELLKNIFHGILASSTAFIGELANFTVGAVFVLISGTIYKFKKSKKGAYLSLSIATFVMASAATALNYFIFLPLYETILGFKIENIIQMSSKFNTFITDLKSLVLISIFPFNLIKGIIISVIVILIYKKLSPLLHK